MKSQKDNPGQADDTPERPETWNEILVLLGGHNGYSNYRGPGKLGNFANRVARIWSSNKTLPDDRTQLLNCLFFEQRRYHHFGWSPGEEEMPYMWALAKAIRKSD